MSHKLPFRGHPSSIFDRTNYSAFSAALDRNPGPGYNTLLFRMISGDLLNACPHGQFYTLPGLLDSRVALSNSYPNVPFVPFYDGLWYDPAGMRTHA